MTLHSVKLLRDIIMELLKEDDPIKKKLLDVIDEIEIDLLTED